jgi:hypothetical protein
MLSNYLLLMTLPCHGKFGENAKCERASVSFGFIDVGLIGSGRSLLEHVGPGHLSTRVAKKAGEFKSDQARLLIKE